MAKKILIIGGGMAGLAAGIHGCRNGYDVEIHEMHNLPGGLCTSWQRKGYTFDGCIHWLVGTKPGSQFNHLWRELGALQDVEVIDHDVFLQVERNDGRALKIYANLDQLEQHLIQHAPQDSQIIKNLVKAAKMVSEMEFPLERPRELFKPWDLAGMLLKMLPSLKVLGQLSRISIRDYLQQITDPFIREALGSIMPTGYPMTSFVGTLASLHQRDAGFPGGGSMEFARSIERNYLALGGRINYRSKVERVLVEDGKAVGIVLQDGRKEYGDLIISAADLFFSLNQLLDGEYVPAEVRKCFQQLSTYSSVQVSLGIDKDLSHEPHRLLWQLSEPIILGGQENHYLRVTNYSFDPSLSPPGKTTLTMGLDSPYGYWAKLAADEKVYRTEKERVAAQAIAALQQRLPGLKEEIEVVDVATPVTFDRYTGVWQGAYMAWVVPPEFGTLSLPKTLPGLKNYYQIGQWVQPPAGLPGSMLTGRHVIQIICHQDRKPFQVG